MDQHFQETHFHATFANPSETTFHSNAPSIGNMVSVTATTRMKTYGVSTVPQQTRHARRIYVGGIPPIYIAEDGIRNFMNTVIAQGLGEENDHSYVLSVYVNQKKCFAFVELKSIELTAACLDLDGIVMKNVVLRILRANEYKPELIPQNFNKVIKFDLSSFQFGPTTSTTAQISDQEEVFVEKTLDTIVQFTGLNGLEVGSVSIVGFPFDEPARKSIGRFATSNTPKLFRSLLHKFKYGMVDNPEFDVDLSKLKVLDVGDILAGKSFDDTKLNLATTTAELIARGCVPFVVGGCKELGNCSSSALLSLYGSKLVTIYVSSRGDVKILDDLRFYGTKFPLNCQGRYVVFAAQGSEFSKDEASFIGEHGGKIVWLSKHLRAPQSLLPSESFRELLKEFESSSLAVMVTLDASALAASANPHASNICSPHGLDFADFAEIAKIAGADPNVVLVNLTEFTIEAEEHSRENFLPVDIFYNFLLGFSLRKESQSRHRVVPNIQTSYQRPFITNVPAYEKAINQLDSVMSRNVVELRQLPSESSLGLTTSLGVRAEPLAFSSTSNLPYASSNLKSAADLHRSLGKTTSTISTVSSNSQNDRYNRSSSSYTFKNSSSFNYSLNLGLGGSQRIGGVSPSLLGTSGILTQSLPDMFGELHSFDENIDLHTESEKAHKAPVKAPPNLKILATQSNDTMHTLPYTSATISEAVASPSSHVGGFIFDDKLLSNHLNMENRDN